jgi:hypothetical protein
MLRKPRESTIVLGILTGFALWLLVVLPLLYRPVPGARPVAQPNQNSTSAKEPATDQNERGSDKVPFAVKIVSAPDGSPEAKREQAEREEKATNERGLTVATWILAFATGLLFIAAAFQVGLFWWQLRLIRESLVDTKLAAEAAKEGADATRDSADISRLAMIASDRAYVHHAGISWVSHHQLSDGRIFWSIRPQWFNAGNTPARQLTVWVEYELRPDPLPDEFVFVPPIEQKLIAGGIPPQGRIGSAHRNVWGDDLAAVREGTRYFYVWGVVRYRDVFPGTPERITKFCAVLAQIYGNPLLSFDAKDNPVELIFNAYHRHNCADEDCNQPA